MFADLHNRLTVLTEELQEQAGLNPIEDRFKVGYITALKDVLQMTYEEVDIREEIL